MKINICSQREYHNEVFYDCVYEWEDVIADVLNAKIVSAPQPIFTGLKKFGKKIRRKLHSLFPKIGFQCNGKETNIVFIMNTLTIYDFFALKNALPIFLDFYMDNIGEVITATRKLPMFFVTSYMVYKRLIELGCTNVKYISLSIADKYSVDSFKRIYDEKDIDVIQFGRKNEVLHQWMLEYCKENPFVEYVYGTNHGLISTKRGMLGKYDNRQDYMKLLSRCKVSLVSSPEKDGVRSFGGNDFITPRFYESAASRCHLIGRYSDTEEFIMQSITDICPNIVTYEQFGVYLKAALKNRNYDVEDEFVKHHVTSKIAGIIKDNLGYE